MNNLIDLIAEQSATDTNASRAQAFADFDEDLAKIESEVDAIEAELDGALARAQRRVTDFDIFNA